jgi:DNA-binding beta-propeller fold protein YncE
MAYQPVKGWGRLPQGWTFREATSVAVDADDNVCVFNRGDFPVIVFRRDGEFLRTWGAGQFRRPHAVTIDPDGSYWLTDDQHHTVRKFTSDGRLLLILGEGDRPSPLQSGEPFNRPTHVALCPQRGDIYVSDGYGNSRIHKFDPAGRYLFSWGEPGTERACFNVPHNVATDADGNVYVADRENHRIQVFDPQGRYLDQWNNLHRPCGLFFDCHCDLCYVGELGTELTINKDVPNIGNRVSILSKDGELVGRIGASFGGEEDGRFIAPHGVAVDSHGDVYVAEVSWTAYGSKLQPPREVRSLQKFRRVDGPPGAEQPAHH